MRAHGDEERLRQLSRMGDASAFAELARFDVRRGDKPIVEERGPETFTTFFLCGVQEAVLRLNEPQIVPFQFSGGVVGLQMGSIEMRAEMETFLRYRLPVEMARLMMKRPDPGIPARCGEPWRPSLQRQTEAALGIEPHEFRLRGHWWAQDWSNVRVEYQSTLFYVLDELHRSAVRHLPQRWDVLTLWLDIK